MNGPAKLYRFEGKHVLAVDGFILIYEGDHCHDGRLLERYGMCEGVWNLKMLQHVCDELNRRLAWNDEALI